MTIPHIVRVDADADAVIRFAADELARYLQPLVGSPLAVQPDGEPFFYVGCHPERLPGGAALAERLSRLPDDSFGLVTLGRNLVIAGRNERAALYGVYAYLEALGARWFFPGPEGEILPKGPVRIAGFNHWEMPDIKNRGLIFEPAGYNDPPMWVDFAAKKRLNIIQWMESRDLEWWIKQNPSLQAEFERRGLRWQLGGHYLRHLFPGTLYREHPDWFRMVDGRRVPDFNLCPSNAQGIAYLQSQVASWVERAPGAEVYHIYGDDLNGGGWCHCPDCRALSPSDQLLMVANAMAEAVRQVQPGAKVGYLAYHDTMLPPARVKPQEGVMLVYAPRERCYAHALDDPQCATNRGYWSTLEQMLTIFPAERCQAFEYYVDSILFYELQPPLAQMLPADLRAYQRAGIETINPLMIRRANRPHPSPPTALFTYPALMWDMDASPDEILADFGRTYLGDGRTKGFFRRFDVASSQILATCGFVFPPSVNFKTPAPDDAVVLNTHLARLRIALRELEAAGRMLALIYWEAPSEARPRLNGLRQVWAFTQDKAFRFQALAKGYLANLRYRQTGDRRALRQALLLLDAAGGIRDVPPERGGFLWLVKPEIEALVAGDDLTTLPGRLESAFAEWGRNRIAEAEGKS
ncbi:MAG: DUF4838 domain-containing protein [Anaerolineae bacterium]|nr:DUF4838 domain-containing protein [Anaerolineae bacterium]